MASKIFTYNKYDNLSFWVELILLSRWRCHQDARARLWDLTDMLLLLNDGVSDNAGGLLFGGDLVVVVACIGQ